LHIKTWDEFSGFLPIKGVTMNHYYVEHPSTPSQPTEFDVHIFDRVFKFTSDRGVFSKDHLDFASRLLIENVTLNPSETFLDLGCGVGVIGLILETQYNVQATLVDINERAIELTQQNKQRLHSKATVLKSDGFTELKDQTFDHIFTNPPIRIGKKELYQMLQKATEHLNKEGALWVVMHKKHGVESLIHFMEQNHKVETVIRKKGFKLLKIHKSN